MKVLTTITLRRRTNCSGWTRSDRQPLCRGQPSAAEHSFRNVPTIVAFPITRVGKGVRIGPACPSPQPSPPGEWEHAPPGPHAFISLGRGATRFAILFAAVE